MTKKKLHQLCTTSDWRWGTAEGAELHTLLLGLTTTFREKIQWLEEAETFLLQLRAARKKTARKAKQKTAATTARAKHGLR
jgi:hypothetical protein